MPRRRLGRIAGGIALAALAALLLSGCLEAGQKVALRYDAATDEFHYLVVYQHIRANTTTQPVVPTPAGPPTDLSEDFQRLKNDWLNRDHLLIFEPVRILGGPMALLRLFDQKYQTVSLENGAFKDASVDSSPVGLSQIQIRPGTLFRDGQDNLSYYHEIVVPGKVLDQWLLAQRERTSEAKDAVAGIDAELDRRKNGGPRISWDVFTARALAQIQKSDQPNSTPTQIASQPTTQEEGWDSSDVVTCLDGQSLTMLRDAIAKGTLDLGRRGSVVYVRLPLTPSDAREACAVYPKLRDAVADAAVRGLEQDASLTPAQHHQARPAVAKFKDGLTLKPVDAGVEFVFDLPAAADYFWIGNDFSLLGDEKIDQAKERSKEMADYAAKRLPVDNDLTVEKIYADFQSGKLRAYPSTQPVAPGAGFSPPATQGSPNQ